MATAKKIVQVGKMIRVLLLVISVFCLGACALKTGLDFEDYLAEEDVTAYVAEQMAQIEKAFFKMDEQPIEITGMDFDEESLFFVFDQGLIMIGFDLSKGRFKNRAAVIYGQFNEDGDFEETEIFPAKKLKKVPTEWGHHLKGTLQNENRSLDLEVLVNESFVTAGTSELDIGKNGQAHLRGILGTRTYVQIKDLIENRPEVKTIVFSEVDGSVNDAINVHTGRLIRRAGLNTRIEASGMIASGGVDLFAAGNQRILVPGAKVGVHSWCCVGPLTADKLSEDHEGHRSQLEYFNFTLGELGTGFYFFTLKAAAFDDIHWMTLEEITHWKVATKVLPKP